MTKTVTYTLRKSTRARSLRVSVYADGRCVVTAPVFLGQNTVERFVQAKSKWITDKLQGFMPFRPIVKRKNSRAEFLKYKEAARKLVETRIPVLNQIYGFKIGRVAIHNQKSRWGSCSAKGNLNFNYKIALLPSHLADYIIVHELCHLGEFNHSQNFWNVVAKSVPDYKKCRAELKKTALSLA
jgi:predicted metal-dependent hydrolase